MSVQSARDLFVREMRELGRQWTDRARRDWMVVAGFPSGPLSCGDVRWRMQDYRRLRVWKFAHELAIAVRRATRAFPRTGYGSLQSQMIRAAESIVFNVVEGCGARSAREFGRYLDIAIKSTMELAAQLELARDYGALGTLTCEALTSSTTDVRRMLCGLRAKVLASPRRTDATTGGGRRTD